MRWQRELRREVELKEWCVIRKYIKVISSNVAVHENFYKVRWETVFDTKQIT